MTKKMLLPVISIVLVFFLFSLSITTPLLAQKSEDIEDFSLEDLLNVEITTAGKKAQKISDIPASVVLVTREDIEKYGYQSLDEILENVSGLYGIDQRDVGGMIHGVRGFFSSGANSIIYLINGVRQTRVQSDGATYNSRFIPVEAIDRIEVIRGPMAVIYGVGAFFGAINIITNDSKNESQVSITYGLEKSVRTAIRASFKKEELSVVMNAGFYDTDGPDIAHSTMSTMDLSESTQFTSTKGLWGQQRKLFDFSAEYKGFYSSFTYDQSDIQSYLLYLPTAEDGTNSHVTYTSTSFGYKHDFSSGFSFDGRFSYHKVNTGGGSEFGWFVGPGQLNKGGDRNVAEDYEIDATLYYNPSKKLNITTGLYYKKRLLEELAGTYSLFGLYYQLGSLEPIISQAMFAQADIAPSKAIRLVLGLRLEQALKYSAHYTDLSPGLIATSIAKFEQDKVEVIPRVAVLFYLNEKNIIKLLYGRAINYPTFWHTVAQATSSQPPLEPEFITTFELNYLAAPSDKFNVNASIFYNIFDGLIENTPFIDENGNWVAGFNENSGEMKTIGAELTLQAQPSSKLKFDLSATFQKTDDNRPGYEDTEVGYSPKFLAYLKASYNLGKDTIFALTGRYVGAMETKWDLTLGNGGSRIANKTDGYFVVGANLRFKNLFGKGYFLALSARNVFDTKYFFPSQALNATWADIGLAGYNRMLMLSIGKKF